MIKIKIMMKMVQLNDKDKDNDKDEACSSMMTILSHPLSPRVLVSFQCWPDDDRRSKLGIQNKNTEYRYKI